MNDQGLDTIVAGVRCRDVLADLSDFLDGALAPARVQELQGHLSACENCARFGGHIAHTLAALRAGARQSRGDAIPAVIARIRAGA